MIDIIPYNYNDKVKTSEDYDIIDEIPLIEHEDKIYMLHYNDEMWKFGEYDYVKK